MTRGGLCVKLKDYEKRHYHPDRLLYPMRRVGPKGSKQFERIPGTKPSMKSLPAGKKYHQIWASSDHSLQLSRHQGLVHGLNGGDAFLNRLGATVCERTFCGEGSCTAWLLTVGPTAGLDPESYIHSKYIVIWACNSISTNLHHWAIVRDAQKLGAKVVVIDAYGSRTAKEADWHTCPKPGTDGALAMALINSIIEQGLVDRDYVEKHTVGFEELKYRASARTPEWAEAITGVPAADIRKLAYELATEQPAAIRMGVALERHYGGGQRSARLPASQL